MSTPVVIIGENSRHLAGPSYLLPGSELPNGLVRLRCGGPTDWFCRPHRLRLLERVVRTAEQQNNDQQISHSASRVVKNHTVSIITSASNPIRDQLDDLRMDQVSGTMMRIGTAAANRKVVDFVVVDLVDQLLFVHALVVVRQFRVV